MGSHKRTGGTSRLMLDIVSAMAILSRSSRPTPDCLTLTYWVSYKLMSRRSRENSGCGRLIGEHPGSQEMFPHPPFLVCGTQTQPLPLARGARGDGSGEEWSRLVSALGRLMIQSVVLGLFRCWACSVAVPGLVVRDDGVWMESCGNGLLKRCGKDGNHNGWL